MQDWLLNSRRNIICINERKKYAFNPSVQLKIYHYGFPQILIQIQYYIMDEGTDKYLIKLCDSKEQGKIDLIKEKLSEFPKYFFDTRSSTLLIYDRTSIFIISK